MSLGEARETIEAGRRDYNEGRPHSSLGNRTSKVFTGGGAALHPEPPRRQQQKQDKPRRHYDWYRKRGAGQCDD
jgi:transposase InsO family protein